MAEPQPAPTDVPLLRGMFGSLQTAAQERQDTASVWSTLRQVAGSWSLQAQGLPQPYDPAVAEATGAAILNAQGIRGDTVSTFRGVAGNWLGAKQALAQLGENAQITSKEIFTPPWSQTAGSDVPSRYRIRTQWQLQSAAGDVFTRWKSDEITAPLSTVGAAIGQATAAGQGTAGHGVTLGTVAPVLLDYEVEQI